MSQEYPSEPSKGLSVVALIYCLNYDFTKAASDVEKCLLRAKPSPKNKRKLDTFTRRADYQSWLTKDSGCSSLLIHGRSSQIPSPLSYLCASIAMDYGQRKNVVMLSYFCGIRRLDKMYGPSDLLRRFIWQLVSHEAVAKIYAQNPVGYDLANKIRSGDVKTLLKVFSSIVRQLRQSELVIFCIIESVSVIEQRKMEEDTGLVISKLNKLVRERKGRRKRPEDRMVFKLLVTAGGQSLIAHDFFSRDDTIDIVTGTFGG